MLKSRPDNHVYRGLLVESYTPSRRKYEEEAVVAGEKGIDIISRKIRRFRERANNEGETFTELTELREDCSGCVQVESRSGMRSWIVEALFFDKHIFFVQYDLKGKIRRIILDTLGPGIPTNLGALSSTRFASTGEINNTHLSLKIEDDEWGLASYQSDFFIGNDFQNPLKIPDAAWLRDETLHFEWDDIAFSVDWSNPKFIESAVDLENGITKYGIIPKSIDVQQINMSAPHLDEVHFALDGMKWQIWYGTKLCSYSDYPSSFR